MNPSSTLLLTRKQEVVVSGNILDFLLIYYRYVKEHNSCITKGFWDVFVTFSLLLCWKLIENR